MRKIYPKSSLVMQREPCAGCGIKFLPGDRFYYVYFVDGVRVLPVAGALVGGPLCYECYWGADPPVEGSDASFGE